MKQRYENPDTIIIAMTAIYSGENVTKVMEKVKKVIQLPEHLKDNFVLAVIVISFILLIGMTMLHFNPH